MGKAVQGLLSITMSGIDGLEILSRIKRHSELAEISVLIVSSRSDGNIVRDSLKAGASDCIVKPMKPVALLGKIEKALQGLRHTVPMAAPLCDDPRFNSKI